MKDISDTFFVFYVKEFIVPKLIWYRRKLTKEINIETH